MFSFHRRTKSACFGATFLTESRFRSARTVTFKQQQADYSQLLTT